MMNPLNYIFNDMRPEKAKLRRHAPLENNGDKKLEAYRETPSELDAPLEPLCDIRQRFHIDHDPLYGVSIDRVGRTIYLEAVDTYPDFQLNQNIVKVAMFLPSLAWRNQKTTLPVFLLTVCVAAHAVFPTFDMLAGVLIMIKTIAALAAMLVTLIVVVGAFMFLIHWAEKGFFSLMAMRPGDKVLGFLMPKWDRHQNKMLLP